MESIEASRKSLLIVSNAFAASSWCQFELTMAQTRLFEEDRDSLILVLLEEIAEVRDHGLFFVSLFKPFIVVEWIEGCQLVCRTVGG